MYDILTFESEDDTVKKAVNAVRKGQSGVTPNPEENYRFIVPSKLYKEGNGGENKSTLVLVGHGSANKLSGQDTWDEYKENFRDYIGGITYTTIFIVACSTANEKGGNKFAYQNWAQTLKKAYPNATVWASSTEVNAETLEGDWVQVGNPVSLFINTFSLPTKTLPIIFFSFLGVLCVLAVLKIGIL